MRAQRAVPDAPARAPRGSHPPGACTGGRGVGSRGAALAATHPPASPLALLPPHHCLARHGPAIPRLDAPPRAASPAPASPPPLPRSARPGNPPAQALPRERPPRPGTPNPPCLPRPPARHDPAPPLLSPLSLLHLSLQDGPTYTRPHRTRRRGEPGQPPNRRGRRPRPATSSRDRGPRATLPHGAVRQRGRRQLADARRLRARRAATTPGTYRDARPARSTGRCTSQNTAEPTCSAAGRKTKGRNGAPYVSPRSSRTGLPGMGPRLGSGRLGPGRFGHCLPWPASGRRAGPSRRRSRPTPRYPSRTSRCSTGRAG